MNKLIVTCLGLLGAAFLLTATVLTVLYLSAAHQPESLGNLAAFFYINAIISGAAAWLLSPTGREFARSFK